MIPTVNFWPSKTQDILNQPVNEQEVTSIPRVKFLEWVKKMKQSEWISDAEALSKWLEYFKSQGKTIEWIDIDSQLSKYQEKVEATKAAEQDVWFFKSIWDVIKKRWDKGAEILTAGIEQSQWQGKAETGVQYAANLIGGLAEVAGTAFVEWLDNVTPEAIQDKFKEWVQVAAETKGGQWVVDKLTEVNNNMETLRELDPRAARNFEAFGNTVDGFLTFYGGKTAKEAIKTWAKQTANIWVKEWIKTGAKQTAQKAWAFVDDTLKAWVKGTEDVAKGTFRQVYKLNQETIDQAFKNPKLFTEAQKMGADDFIRETADKAVDAVKTRIDEVSELWKEYSSIRKGLEVADEIEVNKILDDVLSTVPSKQLTKADSRVVREMSEYVKGYKGKLTDEDLLSLRKQLDSIKFDPNTWLERKLTPQGNKLVSSLRKDIDNLAKDRITGLKELDAKFAPEITELNKLKKVIFDSKGELKDRYIADISNLLGKGNEVKLDRIRKIIPDIDEKLNMYKALKDLDNAVQGFKVGTYSSSIAWPAVTSWVWALLWWPVGAIAGAVLYQMISNPKLWIEIVKKLSMAADMKDSILASMKAWVALKKDQVNSLVTWISDQVKEGTLKAWKWLNKKVWDLADDVATKVWAKSNLVDDTIGSGKRLDDFAWEELIKQDIDLQKAIKQLKKDELVEKLAKIEDENFRKILLEDIIK